ncbi:MAG: type 2 isopentenyl-diphosphate Delta-isomerase [Candidatus Dormibacteria bacterium]
MAEEPGTTASRKAEHIRINLREEVQSGVTTGFERWRFIPRALPELNLGDVDIGTVFLGRALQAPLLISCMTGGTPEATDINRLLARVAQAHGIAIGLGSARALIEHPDSLSSFDVRDLVPDVPLLANVGAVQLAAGMDAIGCSRIVEMLRADALVLHLNALQEALQGGGDVNFAGVLAAIEKLCSALAVPVVVKEVGWGIPPDDVQRLFSAGVAAIDVAGAGGTSWSEVEKYRAGSRLASAAAVFRDWGMPTAEATRRAREAAPGRLIIASGGIASGLDAAKAIALGADLAGVAGPFLRAAAMGEEQAMGLAAEIIDALRITMFCTGLASLAALRTTDRLEPVA